MALSLEGWGEMVFRHGEGGRDVSKGKGEKEGYRVAFRLGVGSDREAAVYTEMRLCKKV